MFGGIVQRNTAQAWEHLVKNVLTKRNVAEYDIKKCFDSMFWSKIGGILSRNAPPFIHNYVNMTIRDAKHNLNKEE